MKLTTIIAAALPAFVVAVPGAPWGGAGKGDSKDLGSHAQNGDWETAPGGGGRDGGQPSVGPGADAHDSPRGDSGANFKGDDTSAAHVEQRDLEIRDDKDHYIRECDSTSKKNCVTNLVVPKGKAEGGCIARKMWKEDDGTIDIIDRNVMCKYYSSAGCKGFVSGYYSNGEVGYSLEIYLVGKIIYNPQSYQCKLIGFQGDDLPVSPGPGINLSPLHDPTDD